MKPQMFCYVCAWCAKFPACDGAIPCDCEHGCVDCSIPAMLKDGYDEFLERKVNKPCFVESDKRRRQSYPFEIVYDDSEGV